MAPLNPDRCTFLNPDCYGLDPDCHGLIMDNNFVSDSTVLIRIIMI